MTTSVKIELDTRSTKKDGSHPLKLLVVVGRSPMRIALGYSIPRKDWNEKTQSVKTSSKAVSNITRLNSLLQREKTAALDTLTKLHDSGELPQLSMKEVKDRITCKYKEATVIGFANSIIDELLEANKVGNASVYKTMRNSIHTFLKRKDIPLRQISHTWLKKYEAWYLGKGNSVNGLGVNMRTLRALMNKAIKRRLLPRDSYPFTNYSVKKADTRKRAIRQQDIEKVKEFEPKTAQQIRSKDYFLMSFYLMGASFIDLAFLRMSSIKNGRIEYQRKKTGKLHSIKITPPLRALLDKYCKDKSGDDFILPVIKSNDPAQQYINVKDELRRYNRRLKEIGELCKIEITLTSYVARHSFATIAKFKDVPVSIISQALGHSNTETTEVYLAEFSNDIMDKYNEEIING
ncbi:MAG: site-specific integrase [Bacteroidota bacterium]